MEIKLNKLDVINYDDNNQEHINFKRELLNDENFRRYFGETFMRKADQIFVSSNEMELKKAYLVKDDDLIVGMIRIFSYHQAGYVNIQYAVRPKCRNQGYGTQILKEISEFLLDNNIKCIEGEIDKNNLGSIKVATSLGYQK